MFGIPLELVTGLFRLAFPAFALEYGVRVVEAAEPTTMPRITMLAAAVVAVVSLKLLTTRLLLAKTFL
jgi:hypothetical protein